MTALVIGATGATGSDLVALLKDDSAFETIHVFVRRECALQHPKVEVHVVDFENIDSWKELLHGDVLFSVLGTTLKQAGSQKAQWRVDYTYQYEVARAARANGVATMLLVSSAWATAESKLFYTRMKGQLEDDVKRLGFRCLGVLRPPSLIRKSTDRFGERISVQILRFINRVGLLRSIRPMPTEQVARAMIALAKESREGTFVLEPQDIWRIR